jgi:alkylation response protein AidB-like acyl-CoA dehydrogenase
MDVLRSVLSSVPPADTPRLDAWWAATAAARDAFDDTIDRALVGGALADRLGFAFASGYSEALRHLVPGIAGIAALCATEKGGNHPRSIETSLVAVGDGYDLSGRKSWATAAPLASTLLVVASTGRDADGTNHLRVVSVDAKATGVTLVPATAPFVPEIPHAEVILDRVVVTAADLLPGDGYTQYLKPFRTVEDLHVHAALVGYAIGVARRRGFDRALVDRLLALAVATRALAHAETAAPTAHLALAGVIDLATAAIADVERAWAAAPDDEYARWQRDRPLLGVAGTARAARRDRAWSSLG